MGERAEGEAFVTLATNDTYALGCLVLANSLRRVLTTRRLVVMVTVGVSLSTRNQLSRVFDEVTDVNVLDSQDAVNLQLLGRPDLSITFTKLHCWRLTQYHKCVFLDADTLILQNVDELFDREELSASPDAGWPDCFNSGVFVFRPNEETYWSILQFAMTIGTFDGGDQGLLNLYYSDWASKDISKHLPFTYNVVSQAFYSYLPAFTQFKDNIKIVHFIGAVKPWHHPYDMKTGVVMTLPGSGHSQEFLQLWWNVFMESVQPSLDPSLTPLQQVQLAPLPQPPDPNPMKHESSSTNLNHESTYQVVFPYVPPRLDKVFYSPTSVNDNENHSENINDVIVDSHEEHVDSPQVVTISLEPVKSYELYETHYAEEPLSHMDTETTPEVIYSAASLDSEMNVNNSGNQKRDEFSSFTDPNESNKEDINEQQKPQPTEHCESNSQPKSEPKSEQSELSKEIQNKQDTGSNGNVNSSATTDDKKRENKDGNSNDKNDKEMGGLIGQLASLQVQGDDADGGILMLDDRERRLAWERGQMDYLGIDKFHNIRKKIDDSIASNSSSECSQTETPKGSKDSLTTKEAPKKGRAGKSSGTELESSISKPSAEAVALPPPAPTTESSATASASATAVQLSAVAQTDSVSLSLPAPSTPVQKTLSGTGVTLPSPTTQPPKSVESESTFVIQAPKVVETKPVSATSSVQAAVAVAGTTAAAMPVSVPKPVVPAVTTKPSVAAPVSAPKPSPAPPKPSAAPPKPSPSVAPPKPLATVAPPKPSPSVAPPKPSATVAPPKPSLPSATVVPPKPSVAPPKASPTVAPPKASVTVAPPKPSLPSAAPKPQAPVAAPKPVATTAAPKFGSSAAPAAPPKPSPPAAAPKPAGAVGAKVAPTPSWQKPSTPTAGSFAPKPYSAAPKPAPGAAPTTAPAPPPKPGSKFSVNYPPPKK